METLKRYDVNKLTLGKNVKETPQGFLIIPAFTARTGIQRYRMADGSMLNEFRPEDEVFSESSMSSLRTAAVTDGHPKDMVTPENAHELMLGMTNGVIEKVREDGEFFLKTHLIITHKKAIDAIRAGKAELSNGYNVDLDFEPGEHNGHRYDAIQRNIVNNHIAIVWKARAGAKASLRLDEKDAILLDTNDNNDENLKKGIQKMKLKLNDKEFEVADELGSAIKAQMLQMSKEKKDSDDSAGELNTEIEVLKTQKSNLVAKIDGLESDLEKAKTPVMDEAEITKRVNETITVRENGKKILDSETIKKLDTMSNLDIKKAVIKSDSPKVDETKLDDENYVSARFDHIVENFVEGTKQVVKIGETVIENRDNKDEKEVYVSPDQKRLDNMAKEQEASLSAIK